MTTEKKAREFWLEKVEHDYGVWESVVTNDAATLDVEHEECLHVIEKSAFDALAAENKDLRLSLDISNARKSEAIQCFKEMRYKYESTWKDLQKSAEENEKLEAEITALKAKLEDALNELWIISKATRFDDRIQAANADAAASAYTRLKGGGE